MSDEVRELISRAPLWPKQFFILVLCLLLNVADGFDVMAMSYAAPSLVADWSVAPERLGVVFSAALLGMALGSLTLAPLADRFGRRPMLLLATAAVAVSMMGVAVCAEIWQLVALRFAAGLGIGVIVPTSATVAIEYSSPKIRNTVVVLVTSGFSLGMVIAGLVSEPMIASFGWRGVFVAGAAITACLLVISFFYLLETLDYLSSSSESKEVRLTKINRIANALGVPALRDLSASSERSETGGAFSALFTNGLWTSTLQAWMLWFSLYWGTYVITQWVPTLLVDDGYTRAQAIDALTYYGFGTLVGGLVLGFLGAKLRLAPVGFTLLLGAAALIAFWVLYDLAISSQLVLFFLVGCTVSALYVFYPIVSALYSARVRVTGLGAAIGFGRFGAMLAPLVAGYVVAAGWSLAEIMLVLVVPPFILAACLVLSTAAAGRRLSQP